MMVVWNERQRVRLPVTRSRDARGRSIASAAVWCILVFLATGLVPSVTGGRSFVLYVLVGTALGTPVILLILTLFGEAIVGADGVHHDLAFGRRFIPWTRIRAAKQLESFAGYPGPIELELADNTTFVIFPRYGSTDDSGAFLGRLRDGLDEFVRAPRSNLVDPAVERAAARGKLTELGADGAACYRERPISNEDLLLTVRDPHAPPAARVFALAAVAGQLGDEERSELEVIAQATAHPQVRGMLMAVHGKESGQVIEGLVAEAKRKPVRMG
jgi:hypothetical protein